MGIQITPDITRPSSSTDNAIVRWDGTTGGAIQNYTSGAPTISDTGVLTATQGGSLTGTWTDLGTVTTIDINGGTIDGVIIGGASAAAITGTTITASTVLLLPSGSVTAPGLVFSAETGANTGFYFIGQGTWGFATDGTELMRLSVTSSRVTITGQLNVTGTVFIANGGALQNAADATSINFLANQGIEIAPVAKSSGTPVTFRVTGAAHTGLTAATEVIGIDFDVDATKTWAAGAGPLAIQREVVFRAPTYAGNAGGPLTITNAATVYISGAPIAGANMTLTNTLALCVDEGTSRFDGRVLQTQGADVASANDLTLGADGNVFEITGTTQINAIMTSGWQNGAVITLLFTSTPTVKHNTAGGAGTAVLLLASASDFNATAGDSLSLVLCEIGGTQAWRETARTVI